MVVNYYLLKVQVFIEHSMCAMDNLAFLFLTCLYVYNRWIMKWSNRIKSTHIKLVFVNEFINYRLFYKYLLIKKKKK